MSADNALPSASDVARDLAMALEARGQEYALGGAIALGFWGEPRGTLDVDVTLFLAPDKPSDACNRNKCNGSARPTRDP